MFDTELFIDEVEKRPCLWDVNDNNYFFRAGRKKAWEEIAAVFFPGATPSQIASGVVPDLQRKWKHIRDYYVREKRKGGTTSTKGKRKKTLQKLHFLDATEERVSLKKRWKKMAAQSSVSIVSDTEDGGSMMAEESKDEQEESAPESLHLSPKKSLVFLSPVIKVEEPETLPGRNGASNASSTTDWRSFPHYFGDTSVRMQDDPLEDNSGADTEAELGPHYMNVNAMMQQPHELEDSDRQFLLSLLPQMKGMNERQNFEFRLDVMKLIKKVRYPTPTNSATISHGGPPSVTPVTVLIKEEIDDL